MREPDVFYSVIWKIFFMMSSRTKRSAVRELLMNQFADKKIPRGVYPEVLAERTLDEL